MFLAEFYGLIFCYPVFFTLEVAFELVAQEGPYLQLKVDENEILAIFYPRILQICRMHEKISIRI